MLGWLLGLWVPRGRSRLLFDPDRRSTGLPAPLDRRTRARCANALRGLGCMCRWLSLLDGGCRWLRRRFPLLLDGRDLRHLNLRTTRCPCRGPLRSNRVCCPRLDRRRLALLRLPVERGWSPLSAGTGLLRLHCTRRW